MWSSRSGGDGFAGAEGFNPGLGIKVWGSDVQTQLCFVLLLPQGFSWEHGSFESFSLEGCISDAGVPEHNCGSHTLCVDAKQHKPEGTPVASWCPVSSCSPHSSAKATCQAQATYRQVS